MYIVVVWMNIEGPLELLLNKILIEFHTFKSLKESRRNFKFEDLGKLVGLHLPILT
jgi:hypothetical protein